MAIHPAAHVDKHAEIDPTAEIGPNVVIEGPVQIGPGTRIYPNAYINGWTTIGANVQIHPGAVIGHLPQDFHFTGERSYCEIGDGTIIREFASVHRGTQPESKTVIGRNCFLLAHSHVAHNCILGDDVKMINNTALGGHVEVGSHALISAYALVHQFVRIGELVIVSGGSLITMDVPPFMTAVGEAICTGPNTIGLRRAGYSPEERTAVKEAFKLLYRSGMPFRQAALALRERATTECEKRIAEFVCV
ncbi:MAG: acyl-ACP--UDP-N-acetylglucosamine O-acyltransferase, partial [Phycisphaerae bacterium]|nr:acyl-ACP--UDP-N-acetylglucosamine O-acyltransferase [Phycisphaerae bacterium]